MSKFCAITGFQPSSGRTYEHQNIPRKGNVVDRMFSSFRDMLTMKSKRCDDSVSKDVHQDSLFSSDLKKKFKTQKKRLLKVIKKHERALSELGKARKICWRSERKVKELKVIVMTQKSSLRYIYAQNNIKARKKALKEMERELEQWRFKLEKDKRAFEQKFQKELSYRRIVQNLEYNLKTALLLAIKNTIRNLMINCKEPISNPKVYELALKIFEETSRIYMFAKAENSPCEKCYIEKPQYIDNALKMQK